MCKKLTYLATILLLATILCAWNSLSVGRVSAASTGFIPQENTSSAAGPLAKLVVIRLASQSLSAYEGGHLVHQTAVITGRPELPTPAGIYHIFVKLSPTTFSSPWPKGSPNWYPPTPINYALGFKQGGFFLHDTTWHSVYGPGTDKPHYDPQFGWQEGSHGCVGMPLGDAAWLYQWAPIGTTVQID